MALSDSLEFCLRREENDDDMLFESKASAILNAEFILELKCYSTFSHLKFRLSSDKSFFAELSFSYITDARVSYKEMAPKFQTYLYKEAWSNLDEISNIIPLRKWGNTILFKLIISNIDPSILYSENEVPNNLIWSDKGQNVLRKINDLFISQKFTDVELVSMDERHFRAHKLILQCVSPVFAAMFKHDTLEKENNKIVIEDMNGEIVSEMLNYIYSGDCRNMTSLARELVFAADKYQLDSLRDLCEQSLINDLNMDNAVELYILSDRYSLDKLMDSVHSLIKDGAALKQCIDSEESQHLSKELMKNLIKNISV